MLDTYNRRLKAILAALTFSIVLCGFSVFSFAQVEEPDVEKLYKEGMYQREEGNLFPAIEAFHTILSTQPALHRVRLELAVAYYRALNFAEAKRQAEIVLQDPKTPENVRLSILAFLAQVKKDEEAFFAKRHTFEPSVSLGFLYDSNVNAGPSEDIIHVGDITLTLTQEALEQDDWAAFASLGLAHRYQSTESMQVGEKLGRFMWLSQANIYRRQYFKEDDYNLDVLSLSTGPSLLVLQAWRVNLNVRADYIRLGDEDMAWYLSLNPNISWQFKNSEITWDATLLSRDFTRDVDAGRDSSYMSTGVYFGRLFKEGKFAVQAGVRVFKEDADTARFSNDGTELLVGANYVAWANGSIYAKVSQKDIQYDDVEPVFAISRDEQERRYEVGFNHTFKEKALKEWKLTGSFGHIDNDSNVSIYEYDRNVMALQLSRSF
jgi:hypothetical protein